MDLFLLVLIIAGGMVLFISEIFPIDLTAGLILGALLLTNIISIEEALVGISNEATVTIGAMFILSYGLTKTGAIGYLGNLVINLARGKVIWIFAIYLTVVGFVSSFINNTAAVAIFLPLGIQLSQEFHFSPSKLLLPLSYASIFGGTLTLIGTSTNILVSNISFEHGLGRLGMFEFSKLGIIFMVAGLGYLFLFSRKLLPIRTVASSLTQKYRMARYLTELRVPQDSSLIGKTALDKEIGSKYDLNVLGIIRGDRKILIDIRITPIEAGDFLIVRGPLPKIMQLKENENLLLLTDAKLSDSELSAGEINLTEVLISPNSRLIGKTLSELDFRSKYGCFVLALRTHGETYRDKLSNIPLNSSDTLLAFGSERQVETLRDDQNFVVLQDVDIRIVKDKNWSIAVATIIGVVLLATFNVFPIVVSSLLGCLLLIITQTITIQDAYKSVDWSIILLLAGVIPLGLAMEKTGLAALIGNGVAIFGAAYGPVFVLASIYLVTSLLTEILSNNSTAVIMTPIAIATANALGVSPIPFIMSVAFAGSASFMTPVGYQTNTMVYGAGGYRYRDYFKFGAPLQFLFLIVAIFFIPLFWPF